MKLILTVEKLEDKKEKFEVSAAVQFKNEREYDKYSESLKCVLCPTIDEEGIYDSILESKCFKTLYEVELYKKEIKEFYKKVKKTQLKC